MKTQFWGQKSFVFILVTILMVTFGIQSIGYAQEATPTITASVEEPLTEANLHGSVVTLTLSGATFERSTFRIRDGVSVSGIDGVTVGTFDFDRVSDTKVTVELTFSGNIDLDTNLVFTVGAGAIADYNGAALTAQVPVTALAETLVATTAAPLTEATLHGNIITLTLTGRQFVGEWRIDDALSFSGIDGVTFKSYDVDRVGDTEVTIKLGFAGNIDEDTSLTLTVGVDAIVGGYDKPFIIQIPVTAVEESLEVSTEAPLTEATLNGGIITLTLTGRQFVDRRWNISDAVSVSGIDRVSRADFLNRVSDTEVTIKLEFAGNIDEDTSLTLTVGADAIVGYDKPFTVQIPVTAVEESLVATTAAPLTEATLRGSVVTLTLSGRQFSDEWDIRDALSVSGIEGVTFDDFRDVDRVSDTEVVIELEFAGNIDTDAILTITVGVNAIIGYNKAFTVQLPVTAVEESLVATTAAPLTEADGGLITLTLTGRRFTGDIADAVSVSGIDGVTVGQNVTPISYTEAIVALAFSGNIDEDATLTLTVGADGIGYDKDFTFQFPVTAVEESLTASAAAPLTEANLDGSTITLTLNGRQFAYGFLDEWYREDAVSVSGIDEATFGGWDDLVDCLH